MIQHVYLESSEEKQEHVSEYRSEIRWYIDIVHILLYGMTHDVSSIKTVTA